MADDELAVVLLLGQLTTLRKLLAVSLQIPKSDCEYCVIYMTLHEMLLAVLSSSQLKDF